MPPCFSDRRLLGRAWVVAAVVFTIIAFGNPRSAHSSEVRVSVSPAKAGGFEVLATTRVASGADTVLKVLTDFAAYARLNPEIAKVNVLSRTGDKARVMIHLAGHPLIPKQWYEALFDWKPHPTKEGAWELRFDQTEGTFKTNKGKWTLTPRPDGSTALWYHAHIRIDLPLAPSGLVKAGIERGVRAWIGEVASVARRMAASDQGGQGLTSP
jgi:ribosome-associated toxin RatA of RatAB toxin-antitoxin module